MNFWTIFPLKEKLEAVELPASMVFDVNAHVHSPYSFSAFNSISHALEMAKADGVKVLGINDFYSVSGYDEWAEACSAAHIFPLFNIEFISLSLEEQEKGIRVNDPNNPGRMYISGKGLSFPLSLEEPYASQLEKLRDTANMQVLEKCNAINKHLISVGESIELSFDEIKEQYTKGLVRERHLAKALRIAVLEKTSSLEEAFQLFTTIFNGKEPKSPLDNPALLENEIRSVLLKSGGPAFVPERSELFLDLESIRQIILKAGGIPTYPCLADSVNGGFTRFEEPKEVLYDTLVKKGIYSVEFIPNRNTAAVLDEYATFFNEKGFVVSFGSEHNTPDLIPIKVYDKDKNDLSDKLKLINFEGASLLVAHQYMTAKTGKGYLNADGEPKLEKRDYYIMLGRKILSWFIENKA